MDHYTDTKRHQEGILHWLKKPGAQYYINMVLCYLCEKKKATYNCIYL